MVKYFGLHAGLRDSLRSLPLALAFVLLSFFFIDAAYGSNKSAVPSKKTGAVKVKKIYETIEGAISYKCGGPIKRSYVLGEVLGGKSFLPYAQSISNLTALAKRANAATRTELLKKVSRYRRVLKSVSCGSPWSDARTWGGSVPHENSEVTIPHGKKVILDVSPPPLASLEVLGTLEVARKRLTLTAGRIDVYDGGQFVAGTEERPFAQKFQINLTGTLLSDTMMGTRGLTAMGGDSKIQLLAKAPKITWTMLNKTAKPGDLELTLAESVDWKRGDEIIVTSTDFDAALLEEREIASVSKNTVTLTAPLSNKHFGELQFFDHDIQAAPHSLDERAEVGILTRNIRITSSGVNEAGGGVDPQKFGGHVMIMGEAIGRFSGIELYHMGQFGELGRYPIHWHNVNDYPATFEHRSYIKKSSVHHSFNRCITVHKTNHVTVEDNVAYDTFGHCYFLEDGVEKRNVYTHNLGARVRRGPLDNTGAAVFWISNANNDYIGNAAGGSEAYGFGFQFDIQHCPRVGSISEDPSCYPSPWWHDLPEATSPKKQPAGIFRDNRAHSVGLTDGNSKHESFGLWSNAVYSKFENFTGFKNGTGNVWLTDGQTIEKSSLSGDVALFVPGGISVVKNCLILGKTEANASDSEFVREYLVGNTALRGYDGQPAVESSVFVNFRGAFGNATNDVLGKELRSKSRFLNTLSESNPYKSVVGFLSYMRNVFWQVPAAANAIPDPGDSFDNGGPGTFIFSEFLNDGTCKGRANGGKGIGPEETGMYWCPHQASDYSAMSFRLNYSNTVKPVLFRNGESNSYGGFPGWPSGGTTALLMTDKLYRIGFENAEHQSIEPDTLGASISAAPSPGHALLIALAAPAGAYEVKNGLRWSDHGYIPQANSRAEFDAFETTCWYLDGDTSTLYMKLKNTQDSNGEIGISIRGIGWPPF